MRAFSKKRGLLLAAALLLLPAGTRSDESRLSGWFEPPPWLDRVEYAIITGKSLAEAWQPLADRKCLEGCPAVVVAVEDVLANPVYRGVDPPETLRNFVRDLYWKWGLSYVLLGGDVNVVPTRYVNLIEKGASDVYYGSIEENWNEDGDSEIGGARDRAREHCEVLVGRVPAETPGEVRAFLTKYFHYVQATRRDYQKKFLCLGAVLGNDYHWDADDHYRYVISEFFEPAGFKSVHLDQTDFLRGRFEKDPATGKCSGYLFGPPNKKDGESLLPRTAEEISRGFGIVSHLDHSNTYLLGLTQGGIRPGDVKLFTNAERPSVFISSGCHANQFDMESVSEACILHPGGGAVAFIGCTVNNFAYSNLYERDFYEALFRHGEFRLGRAFEASRARLCAMNLSGANPVTVLNRNLALLGDPHMQVWTGAPKDLNVSCEDPGKGSLALELAVSGPDGPVQGAAATLFRRGDYFVTAMTGAGGKAVLPLPASGLSSVELAVSAMGFVTFQRAVKIGVEEPRGSLKPLDVSAESIPSPDNPEARILKLTAAVENRARKKFGAVTASISGEDPHLEPSAASCEYGPMEPDGVALPRAPFSFAVKGSPPPHHRACFRLTIEADGATAYEGLVRFGVTAPSLVLAGHSILRSGAPGLGPLDAGEKAASLLVSVANRGTAAARSVTLRLECPSGEIAVREPEIAIERIEPGLIFDCPKPFALDVSPSFSGGPVEFVLSFFGPGLARREEVFTVLEPPAAPAELSAEASAEAVKLVWKPVDSARLLGYTVERAEAAQGPFTRLVSAPLRSSLFEDSGLAGCRTYHYRVRAVDRDLNPGGPSPVVSVTTTFPRRRDWPKKTKSAPDHVVVCDVDGDGELEIATADGQGVWIWRHTGEELRHGGDNWTFGLFRELPEGGQTPTFADLDGDGVMEILSAGRHGDRKVYVFRLDGSDAPGWPREAEGRLMTPPQVADLDRDGHPEVIFHEGFGKNLHLWRKDGSACFMDKKDGKPVPKTVIAQTDPFSYFVSSLVDLDGDGRLEIAGFGGRGSLFAFRMDGTPLPGFPYKAGEVLGSTAPAGDITGDGRPSIVFVAGGGTELTAVDNAGKLRPGFPVKVWQQKPAEGRSLPVLADLDGKPGLEIAVGGRGGELFAVTGAGKTLPGFPVKLPAEAGGCAVGDVDGDGDPEIVCGCLNGRIFGFHHDGAAVAGFPLQAGAPVTGQPVLCDVDGDGLVNLIAGSDDGYVHIWDLSGQFDPGAIQWAMYGADPARTGAFVKIPDPPSGLKVRGDDRARLSWQGPKKGKVDRYHVWRGAGGPLKRLSKAPVKGASFTDQDIVPGRLYVYSLTSVDHDGRESRLCERVEWGEEAAVALMENAKKQEDRKRWREAMNAYEELVEKFPGSRLIDDARNRLDRLKSDSGVQESEEARRRDEWCRGMIALAGTWIKSGKPDKAREALRKVLDRYPDTSWAEKAGEELKKIK